MCSLNRFLATYKETPIGLRIAKLYVWVSSYLLIKFDFSGEEKKDDNSPYKTNRF